MNKFYLAIWLFVGIVTLLAGDISALSYGCLWLFTVVYFTTKVIEESEKNKEER